MTPTPENLRLTTRPYVRPLLPKLRLGVTVGTSPAHVERAAAVAHGQLIGSTVVLKNGSSAAVVSTPSGVVSPAGRALCFAFHPSRGATCQQLKQPAARLIAVPSGASRYYVTYYAFDGLPSLPFPGPVGVYLMRLLSLLMCTGLFAIALSSLRYLRQPVAILGLLVATTPMVIFLASVVNPNSIEILAGVAFWSAGAALVHPARAASATSKLVRMAGVAGTVMLLMRPTSPVWLLLSILILAGIAGARQAAALVRRRDVQVCAAVFLTFAFANVAWTLLAGAIADAVPHPPVNVSLTAVLAESLRLWPRRNQQLVGIFGWLDTTPPTITYVIWWGFLAAGVIVSLLRAARRWRLALLASIAIAAVFPVLIEATQAHSYGWPWQGRYTLPFAVGVPVLAGCSLVNRLSARVQRWALVVGARRRHHRSTRVAGLQPTSLPARRWTRARPVDRPMAAAGRALADHQCRSDRMSRLTAECDRQQQARRRW